MVVKLGEDCAVPKLDQEFKPTGDDCHWNEVNKPMLLPDKLRVNGALQANDTEAVAAPATGVPEQVD